MSATKPCKVQYAWKHADKKIDAFAKDLLKWLDLDTDSNPTLSGVQNPFNLNNIIFRADCPGVDVFAIGISPGGVYESPGFWRSSIDLIVKEAGGIDAVQTSFEVLAPGNSQDIATEDHLETPSGETMRIEGITPGSPNYTLTVERGAHGTEKAAIVYEGLLTLMTPRVGMKRIILVGDTEALAAPVMATPQGMESGILLSWSHSYTTADLLRLKGWRIYYSDTAEIDLENPGSYDGDFEIEGIDKTTIFNPRAAGLADVDTTYYFAMTALTKSLLESILSNEVSGKVYGTIGPNPAGPEAPSVTIEVNGTYRLKVEAKKPTGTNSALGVMNVKKATIEIYYANTDYGNPTAGTPDENQIKIDTYYDTSSPYSIEIGVSAYGFKDFWARVFFTDGNNGESAWGLSSVFNLNPENNTTDNGVATGLFLNTLTDELNPFPGGRYGLLSIGLGATGNYDSAKKCELAFRVDGVGTFDAEADLPFAGATDSRSTPRTRGGYPGRWDGVKLEIDRRWEITGRIENAYGWTNWLAPAPVNFTGNATSADTDVCTLAGFGAWTRDFPPPGGWTTEVQKPGPGMATFVFNLPAANSSTVWSIAVEGITGASFPSENILKTQANGTAVAMPGAYEATITGFAATLNQYQNKYIRIGKAGEKNTTDFLQVRHIASNTAGDNSFTITVSGNDRLANIDNENGSVEAWAIIDVPIWKLVNYYENFPISGGTFGAATPKKTIFEANATGMKFRATANNRWGYDAARESDTTLLGTLTPGAGTYKSIDSIKESDVKDDAITPAKASNLLNPIGHTLAFTPTSNKAFSWAAGTVYFQDGSSVNLGAGASGNLSTDSEYWISFNPLAPGGGLTIVTSPASAMAGGKVLLGICTTTADATEFCSVFSRWGKGSKISAVNIICAKLASLAIETGTLNGGIINGGIINGATIQTSPTASEDGGIVLNGTDFTLFDTNGKELLKIDKANGITVYGFNGVGDIVAKIDHASFGIYDSAGVDLGLRISPGTNTAGITQYWDGNIIGSIHGTAAAIWSIIASSGVDLDIYANNFLINTY